MFRWIDDSAEALLVVDAEAREIVAINAAARAALDLVALPDFPIHLSQLLGPDGELEAALRRPTSAAGLLSLHRIGSDRPVQAGLRPLTDRHVLFTLADGSKPSLQHLLTDILNELPVAVEIYDQDLNALFYNRMSDDLFLYEEKPVVHHDEWWELGFPDPEARAAALVEWRANFERLRSEPGAILFSEWSVRCRDHSTRIVQFRYRRVANVYVLALWDVTSERQIAEQLRTLAGSDPLTGLWNRRRLMDAGEVALSRGVDGGPACSLLLLDIDHFKRINDSHGHGFGDLVLQQVARRSLAQLRDGDLMARIGGDEFAVLLPAISTGEARALAGRLRDAIRQPMELDGDLRLRATVSIGLARALPGDDFPALIERCDRALYRAKQDGRDGIFGDEA